MKPLTVRVYVAAASVRISSASIAQRLEHWSCKPGVASSILTGGRLGNICFFSAIVEVESVQIEAAQMNHLAPPPVYNEHELRGAESRTDDNVI